MRRSPAASTVACALVACAIVAFVAGRVSAAAGERARLPRPAQDAAAAREDVERALVSAEHPTPERSAAGGSPRWDERGRLLRPSGVLQWVLVGSSVGLGYSERERVAAGPGFFHQVFLEPSAFRRFAETGAFPEGTMLALVVRETDVGAAPAADGHVAGALAALEIAVKDGERFDGDWAYFDFTADGGAVRDRAAPFPRAACQACHARHAARDNVFLQFYPVLRELPAERGRAAAHPERRRGER